MEAEVTTTPRSALSDTDINWDRLDKTKFHILGAILFTAQSGLLHPTTVVKTRMQIANPGPYSYTKGMSGFTYAMGILRNDGIAGIFRGFGTSAIGSMPGRVLALTSLEMSKDIMLKHTQSIDIPEASRIGLANAVAGIVSGLVSCVYFVPLDVTSQRLMVQGLPKTTCYGGPFDVIHKVVKAEGFRGLYRGFGSTALTQSSLYAVWWGSYGAAQHIIWRNLGYKDDMEKDKRPSHLELVTVQATAGMVAGACSSVIATPIDTAIKENLEYYHATRPSILKTTRTLLKEDGMWGLYRGFGPNFLKMSLYGTTIMVTYELIKRLSVKSV